MIIFSTVFVLSLFIYSCSMITGNQDEPEFRFEKETYIVEGEVLNTYRSLDVISIQLKTGIDLEEFNEYVKSNGLQHVRPFSHSHYSAVTATQIQGHAPIVLLLPSNVDHSQYYSFSDNLNEDSFANNRFIVYSLPAYTRDPEQLAWYYPNNIISVKPSTEDFSVTQLSEQFNLEFQSKNSLIDLYTFSDIHFSHGSPYNLAQSIYDSGNYKYVVPNGFWEIVRH
ncbi:MAG: hypothetical protein LAT51_10015 [Flavobacteriaceae bacterium]|nr:hypothetical protein [Flavobacteriaceae bacterium]